MATLEISEVPGWVVDDPEWAAAVWLLQWNATIWRRSAGYVDFDAGLIHFDDLLDQGWSSGERTVIEVAWSLYNAGWAKEEGRAASVGDLGSSNLGDDWLDACLHALAIRRRQAGFYDRAGR